MITSLQGTLAEVWPNRIVIDVRGVGYEVLVPLDASEFFGQPGREAKILTHLHIREQEHTLYGFRSADQRDLFRLLINRVSGVGPKVAMAILSGMDSATFKKAVATGDLESIARIKGLGKKTAERIVLELKDKIGVADAWEVQSRSTELTPEQSAANDAVLGLISLGYKKAEAEKAVARAGGSSSNADEMLRAALRLLQ